MKRRSAAASAFFLIVALAGGAARAQQTILYTFTGLPGAVGTCQWFNDNLNNDRDVGTLTRQTDLLYNRLALPAGEPVTIGQTATSAVGEQLVDFKLGSRTICTGADAIYGPSPAPSPPSGSF
ncbi:MAG: hypothetical protein WCB99_10905 [Candidatus Cybelea sp.]|jgi:hypothetical protein